MELLKSLFNLLDPWGIIEICPPGEYDDFSESIMGYLIAKDYAGLEEYVRTIYIDSKVDEVKFKEFMNIITILFDKNDMLELLN